MKVTTARVRGERITPDHLSDVCALHQNAGAMKFMGGARDEAWSVEYLERHVAHWDRYGFGTFVLRSPGTDDFMGLSGMRHLDVEGVDEVEVGYGFLPEYWGRGLATEVATACVSIARDDLRVTSVIACTSPPHTASIRVMVKAGFVFERRLTLPGGPAVLYRARIDPTRER